MSIISHERETVHYRTSVRRVEGRSTVSQRKVNIYLRRESFNKSLEYLNINLTLLNSQYSEKNKTYFILLFILLCEHMVVFFGIKLELSLYIFKKLILKLNL